ncbi:MAG: hypothetical protein IKF01_01585 [Bacilli bacterium]|nr:hypothetical protein [Bacilli bacterium]
MDENVEMLEYIYKSSNGGHSSAENLIKALENKDNKIKKLLEDINKGYEHFEKESHKLLKKYDRKVKTVGVMGKMMSKMGINEEVMKDNSDSSMADMLIQGLTLGNLEMDKRIDNYEGQIERKIMKIAKEYRDFGKEYVEKLKPFL